MLFLTVSRSALICITLFCLTQPAHAQMPPLPVHEQLPEGPVQAADSGTYSVSETYLSLIHI